MALLQLTDCVTPLAAKLVGTDVSLGPVGIDSRSLDAGDVYVALRGEKHDGHNFIDNAIAAGASAVVVDHELSIDIPQLIVADTRIALQQLARVWFDRHRVPTIAITGSNGKTTVKEIITTLLGEAGSVCATAGNFNNDIGVPLTLLSIRPEHRYAVIEMGANHPGEIALLSRLVEPNVAVINNVGAAHLEGFGTEADVAKAKSEIFLGLGKAGVAIINNDDAYRDTAIAAATPHVVRTFGTTSDADVYAINLAEMAQGATDLQVQIGAKTLKASWLLAGRHNIMNALAGISAATSLGLSAEQAAAGLAKVSPVPGRMQPMAGLQGSVLINDSYNANPNSARAAIDTLAGRRGERWLVLGDMAELGENARQLHAEIGVYAQKAGLDRLYGVGPLSQAACDAFSSGGHHFESVKALTASLAADLTDSVTLLVKGSRGSRMERVVIALCSGGPASGSAS